MQKLRLSIQPQPIHYEIVIGQNFGIELSEQNLFFIVDSFFEESFPFKENVLFVQGGEKSKTRKEKERIENVLLEKGIKKNATLCLVGGGTLLDLGAFVASTYKRGIPYIAIPTTLLAMTDATIGGKTGVNVKEFKNQIGTFYHPKKVIIDLSFLETLPEREFRSGLIESIKHGLIYDPSLFEYIESHLESLLNRQKEVLETLIFKSLLVKKAVVEEDPFEVGKRALLNFGHTVGHALESTLEFKLNHGEAVSHGIAIEALLSHKMGHLKKNDLERIVALLKKVNTSKIELKGDLFATMSYDKKSVDGEIKMVLLDAIGKAHHPILNTVSKEELLDALCTPF